MSKPVCYRPPSVCCSINQTHTHTHVCSHTHTHIYIHPLFGLSFSLRSCLSNLHKKSLYYSSSLLQIHASDSSLIESTKRHSVISKFSFSKQNIFFPVPLEAWKCYSDAIELPFTNITQKLLIEYIQR